MISDVGNEIIKLEKLTLQFAHHVGDFQYIDVGGAGDVDSRWLKFKPFLDMVSFEPDQLAIPQLQQNLDACRSAKIFTKTLGKHNLPHTFYKTVILGLLVRILLIPSLFPIFLILVDFL